MPRCARGSEPRDLYRFVLSFFPLEKPALPHFHRERRGRGCPGQRDCAKLCTSPLQNLPKTCRKTLRKRRLLKAVVVVPPPAVVLPAGERSARWCRSCGAWQRWCLSCRLRRAAAPAGAGAKQLGAARVGK